MDQITEVPTEQTVSQSENYQIQFHGKTAEYFSIWIKNVFLTLLTLGIYAAWAKVRKKKYLYGNVEVAGARFDYHGDPVKILMGYLLMGSVFLIYYLGANFSTSLSVVGFVLFITITPWLFVRAMMFNFSNTSYRNIRFGFKKDYEGSYSAYILTILTYIFTLGIGFPFALYRLANFKLNGLSFGNQSFSFKGGKSHYVQTYYVAGLLMLVPLVIGVVIVKLFGVYPLVMAGLTYSGIFFVTGYIRAEIHNAVANNTTIGPIQMKSNLNTGKMAWIYFSNVVACILTLGLAIPWATLRVLKYRLENTQVIAQANSLETISAVHALGTENVAADAAANIWDIELGF